MHPVVAGTAELGAENGVGSRCGGSEVEVDGLAGNGVLLEAHLGYGETVNNILGPEAEVYLAVNGEDEFGGDEVVRAVGVSGVDADGIAFARGDEFGIGAAEGGVRTWVAEVPGKLHARDFNLEGRWVRTGIANGGPEEFGLDGEGGKEDDKEADWEVLNEPATAGLARAAA